MSVRTMARVWADSKHGGTDLLMLLAIADFADDDGNAYPAVGTLAAKCRMKPRNATYILRALEVSGELQIRINEGPKGANRYRIVLEALGVQRAAGVQSSAPLQSLVATPAILGIQPLQPIADEPSLNHQEPPLRAKPRRGRSTSLKTTFKAWYEAAKAINPKVLPEDDPIHAYMTKVGMNYDFMVLHWHWFKAKQLAGAKLQANWPQTFRNSVRGNYGRLWYRSDDGTWKLTTAGKQAALEHECDPNMTSCASHDWTRNYT
jgi:hypothetical protein